MQHPVFPTEDVVGRAVAAVVPILQRHGLDGRAPHVARRVAQVVLRTAYFSHVPDNPVRESPSDLRWCGHCGGEREVIYRDVAWRCVVCDGATQPRIRPLDIL